MESKSQVYVCGVEQSTATISVSSAIGTLASRASFREAQSGDGRNALGAPIARRFQGHATGERNSRDGNYSDGRDARNSWYSRSNWEEEIPNLFHSGSLTDGRR